MGKIHFSRDRTMLQNSPLLLKQIRSKQNLQKSKKLLKVKKLKNIKKTTGTKHLQKRKLSEPSSSLNDEEPDCKRLKSETDISTTEHCSTNADHSESLEDCQLIFKNNYDHNDDLFLADESKCSYEPYKVNDMLFQIIDEISLEGLDGITLEALWKRIRNFYEAPVLLHETCKNVIWNILCSNENINFFELEQPRPELHIHNRDEYMDVTSGISFISDHELDIYPFCVITHPEVRGSCKTFNTRKNITNFIRSANYEFVVKEYGTKLVIVASQELRNNALFFELADRNCVITQFEYCLLERIGRGRKQGEITQGRMSLNEICGGDAKLHFHNKKALKKLGLITSQSFFTKSSTQNVTGRLLHLSRFQTKNKLRQLTIIEQIFHTLKFKPQGRMDILEFRKIFGFSQTLGKLLKSSEFQKFVKTNERVPYREVYPNAKEKEWLNKNKSEKYLRMLQVIDPSANIEALWERKNSSDEESSDDEFIADRGIFTDISHEVFQLILSRGKEGISFKEVLRMYNMEFYTIRATLKKLQTKNVIDCIKYNDGRQTYGRYFARCYNDPNLGTVDVTPKPIKLKKSVLDRIKEKQKNGIKNSNNPIAVPEAVRTGFINFVPPHFEVFQCVNYIKNADEIITLEVFSPSIAIKKIPVVLFKPVLKLLNLKAELQDISLDFSAKFEETINLRDIKNFESNCVSPIKSSNSIKVLLLKLFLDNLKHLRDVKVSPQIQDLNDNKPCKRLDFKDNLLGPNPEVLLDEVDEKQIKTTIVVSTKPQTVQELGTMYSTRNIDITEKTLNRTNLILKIIYREKIVDTIFKIGKEIELHEMSKGIVEKIDRRSIYRILGQLITDGYLKVFKLIMVYRDTIKHQYFFCDMSVDYNHCYINSARDQFKIKIVSAEVTVKADKARDSLKISASADNSKILTNLKYDRHIGASYGYRPKCIRMQILHEFLFYLIYDHKSDKKCTTFETAELLSSHRIEITNSSIAEFPELYCKEISWKTFIPPLPQHKGYSAGWALVSDVIYRLPLSVFVKIFNVTYDFPEIHEFLNHPIKRHYLLKDLHPVIQNVILHNRKHLFSIHITLTRLCYIGLLQFGPQKLKEKDQVFIYLNRHASLLDTSTSKPSYHEVSPQEYKKLQFHFNSQSDLEDYWCHVWTISMNTPLGQRNVAAGKFITVEEADYKADLIEVLKPRESEFACLLDCGEIPGDHLGACGLDSALWFHLKRNWMWTNPGNKPTQTPFTAALKTEQFEKVLSKPIMFDQLTLAQLQEKVYLPKKDAIKKCKKSTTTVLGKKAINTKVKGKKKKVIRKIIKQKGAIRSYYDAVDRAIIKQQGTKFKSSWSPEEDRILRYAKAAVNFFSPNLKKIFIPYVVIRDVLHSLHPQSKDKTSKSCQRRLKLLMSSERDAKNIDSNSNNLIQLGVCKQYFNKVRYIQKQTEIKLTDLNVHIAFIYFMNYIVQHSNQIDMVLEGRKVTLDYFSPKYISNYRNRLLEVEEVFKYKNIPETADDIRKEVIKSIIHSSLGYKTGEANWSYQIFRIYQKFPDYLIRNAVSSLKNQQLISIKVRSKQKKQQLNHVPFQLSNLYVYMLSSTFTTVTAYDAFKKLQEIVKCHLENKAMQHTSDKRYGTLLTYNELLTISNNIKFNFEIPEMVVELNPEISDHTEVIKELAIRYEVLLKDKKEHESNLENFNIMTINFDYINYNTETVTLNQIKEVTLKLLDGLPPTCKENIKLNYIKMMDDKTNEEINHYVNMIVSEIKQICTLFLVSKECCDTSFLGYVNRLFRMFQETVFASLHAVEKKIAMSNCIYVISAFFTKNDCANDKTTPVLLSVIKSWIHYINRKTDTRSKDKFSCNHHFCYVKPELQEPNVSSVLDLSKSDASKKLPETTELKSEGELEIPVEQDKPIPTLEQIMKEMMEKNDYNTQTREVPHITDLTTLLSKERFPELLTDDETMENLRRHFITRFPKLRSIEVENIHEFLELDRIKKLLKVQDKSIVLQKIKNYTIIQASMDDELEESLMEQGGSEMDFNLAQDIIAYVFEKDCIGCTNKEIKEKFGSKFNDLPLYQIIDTIVDLRIFLRAGVSCITFVHHKHQSEWLVQTFLLSQYEKDKLNSSTKDEINEVNNEIEKRIRPSDEFEVRVMPWTKVDGTLNQPLFEKWMCTILSHCLDHPGIPLTGLIARFSYLTPVDLFYMLEVLQMLGSIEICVCNKEIVDLFSFQEFSVTRPVNCLDDFEDVFVQCNSTSMLCVGSFLDRDDIEFI